MDVVVTPATGISERRALLVALERTTVRGPGAEPFDSPWWRAGLREAVDGDELDPGYAFSPRSTRGATRA